MRLGVGITTRLPRDLVGFERQAVERLTPELTDLVVVHDDDPGYTEVVQSLKNSRYEIPQRLGIARAKNMCLKELAGCDYIILLDDDIWPVAPDWAALLIRAHEVSGIHHFVYVPETGVQDRPWATHFEPLKTFHYDGLSITSFNNCTGCLLFLTQTVIQRVGGMMIYPAHYGFEHAGYSRRIHSAGLMQNAGPYTCVDGFAPRIWSVDMQGLPQDLVGYHTASSMVTAEVAGAVAMNLKAFEKDTQIYQPLEEESRHCRAGRWD